MLLFSLFDFDPRPKFRESLNRISTIDRESMAGRTPPLDPGLARQPRVSAAWDRVFGMVRGDRVATIFGEPQVEEPGDLKRKLKNEVTPAYALLIGSRESQLAQNGSSAGQPDTTSKSLPGVSPLVWQQVRSLRSP